MPGRDLQLERERDYHTRMRKTGDRAFCHLAGAPFRCPTCGAIVVALSRGSGKRKLVCDYELMIGRWTRGQQLATIYRPDLSSPELAVGLWPGDDERASVIPSTVEGRPIHVCSD